jgi:hypothetical protein
LILLAIGLAGLCPLIVIQLKLSRMIARSNEQPWEASQPVGFTMPYLWPDKTFFLAPAYDPDVAEATPWLQKLGVPATLLNASYAPGTPNTSYNLTILSFTRDPVADTANLTVKATPASSTGTSP